MATEQECRELLDLPPGGRLTEKQILDAFHDKALSRLCDYSLDGLRELADARDMLLKLVAAEN